MKPISRKRVLGLVLLGLLAQPVIGAEAPTSQAQCERQAKETFEASWGKGSKRLSSGRTVEASHRAYYSAKQKACRILVETRVAAGGGKPAIDGITLYEHGAGGRITLGAIGTLGGKVERCQLRGKLCTSRVEWDAQAATLMKD